MIYLCSGITENYYEKAKPFLQSLDNILVNKNVRKIVLTLDFILPKLDKKLYPSIEFTLVPTTKLKSELTKINCLQHGRFLDYINDELSNEDVIIFTDADIFIQRDMTPEEIEKFSKLSIHTIFVGPNNHQDNSLMGEYKLLEPKVEYEEILNHYEIQHIYRKKYKIYNTGVVAATVFAWQKMLNSYVAGFAFINANMRHYAKQQFLMSIIMQKEFNVEIMPQSIHTHGHFGLVPYATIDNDDTLLFDGKPVLFRHKI